MKKLRDFVGILGFALVFPFALLVCVAFSNSDDCITV